MQKQYHNRNCTWKVVPDTVMFELTNACNFECIMCSNKHMTRKIGYMSKEVFKKGLDACTDANIQHIKLYTTGESLLHPKFLDFFKLADSYNFKTIMISTNGSLLTEELLSELLKSDKIRIQFSFSGWNKKSYELRYINGNYEETLKKIQLIIDCIAKKKLPKNILTINGVVSKDTSTIAKCKMFLKEKFAFDDVQLQIHHLHNWIQVVSNDKHITSMNRVKSATPLQKRYCHIANTRIGILYDGKVTACGCLDVNGSLIMGNILESSIAEIRKGKEFTEFVRQLTTGEVSELMCVKCRSLKVLG